MLDLILASTSPYRKKLLDRLGIPFRTCDPKLDEKLWKTDELSPEELAKTLSREKSLAVFRENPDSIVIGGDQVVEIDGVILGKPGEFEQNCHQLSRLSGKTHRLLTAFTVMSEDREENGLDETSLTMRDLLDSEIEEYVGRDRPYDCAGGYKIESCGIALFERIQCRDFTAIEGLPLIALCAVLRRFDFRIP